MSSENVPQVNPDTVPDTGITPPVNPPSWRQRILHWEHLGLLVILVITLIFHFVAINKPQAIAWDEVWYIGDGRSIMSRTGELRPEHPPLAKLFIVAGEYIFSGFSVPEKDTGVTNVQYVGSDQEKDIVISVSRASDFRLGTTILIESEQMDITGINPTLNEITVKRGAGGSTVSSHSPQQPIYVFEDNFFGWRFFSIVFGTIGIVFLYFICRRLRLSRKATLVTTLLFAFENMTYLHSGLALLDVYMVTFMLGAVLFYLDEKYVLCGIFVALSAECKLVGVLILIAILLHWAIYRKNNWARVIGSLVVAAISFVVFLVIFDYFVKGGIENPITRIHELLSGTAANQFTVPKLSISSRPWTWIYPQFVQVYDNSPNVPFIIYYYDPQYISFISSTIQILIVPTIGYMVYKALKGSQAATLVFVWFLATYLIWIPLDVATNRVTFVFYFLPTIPAICIGIGIGLGEALDKLRSRWITVGRMTHGVRAGYAAIALYLLLHLAIFVVFNPALPTIIKLWLPPFAG
jgi:dolichyl-phosphate-mannose-protein mannosyltransferase